MENEIRADKVAEVEIALEQLSNLVTSLSMKEMAFLGNNSVAYRRLRDTFRAGHQIELNVAQAIRAKEREWQDVRYVYAESQDPRP